MSSKVKLLSSVLVIFMAIILVGTISVLAGTINVDKDAGSCVNGTGQSNPGSVVYCKIQERRAWIFLAAWIFSRIERESLLPFFCLSSWYFRAGTSICKSIRSRSGPESLER